FSSTSFIFLLFFFFFFQAEDGIRDFHVTGVQTCALPILLRKPRLLIFDEATSALDSLTEEDITNTIRTISKSQEQISILIAHRLSTIMHADTIYVLEKGKIVESGSHADLLEQKGLFYAMWRQQIGERREPKRTTVKEEIDE